MSLSDGFIKSSTFPNQSNIISKELIKHDFASIDILPTPILHEIFGYVHTPDLLHLCLVSRNFYCLAVGRLYRQILITTQRSETARLETQSWSSDKCTVTGQIQKLRNTLENPNLASLVQSLIINEENPHLWTPLFLSCKNLRRFHYRDDVFYPSLSWHNFEKVTCYLRRPSVLGPRLSEFRITYDGENGAKNFFKSLANDMINVGAHQNLRTLVFDRIEPDLYGADFQWESNNRVSPAWMTFFAVFAEKNIRLELTALSLDGYFKETADEVAEIVHSAVDFENLSTLELKFNEEPHFSEDHALYYNENAPSFLEKLAQYAPSLENLCISYGNCCSSCGFVTIKRALEGILKNQLRQLCIRVMSHKHSDLNIVKKAILGSQQNLMKLKIHELLGYTTKMWSGLPGIDEITKFSFEEYENERSRSKFAPNFVFTDRKRPHVSERNRKMIEKNLGTISQIMASDCIYKEASSRLPHLVEYCANDFCISMGDAGVVVNGDTMHFANVK